MPTDDISGETENEHQPVHIPDDRPLTPAVAKEKVKNAFYRKVKNSVKNPTEPVSRGKIITNYNSTKVHILYKITICNSNIAER